ncbi:hypothetical protein INR49_007619 [Caranx melampygus]|nr:hypothetical protein INR49_007619 [Caranx melampygus]
MTSANIGGPTDPPSSMCCTDAPEELNRIKFLPQKRPQSLQSTDRRGRERRRAGDGGDTKNTGERRGGGGASQVAAVYINKKTQDSSESSRRTDKLSPSEIKVVCAEVSGWGRRLHRHVCLNRLQDVALCWWSLDAPGEELWPWTPTNTHRNNLVILSCSPAEGLKCHLSGDTELNQLHLLLNGGMLAQRAAGTSKPGTG